MFLVNTAGAYLMFMLIIVMVYDVQTYMDSEIRAIMAQYMPLDNQAEIEVHGTRGNV